MRTSGVLGVDTHRRGLGIPVSIPVQFACDWVYPSARHRAASHLSRRSLDESWWQDTAADLRAFGFTDPRRHQVNHATAISAASRRYGALIVAVRGTDDLFDAIDDANAVQADSPDFGGRVHAGVVSHASLLWDSVQPVVTDAWQSGLRLIFCGHSLGGVVATALAYALARLCGACVPVVTCGAPRYGDPEACREVDQHCEVIRLVHRQDAVAVQPWRRLWRWSTGWQRWGHPGSLRYYTSRGTWHSYPGDQFRPGLWVDLALLRWQSLSAGVRSAIARGKVMDAVSLLWIECLQRGGTSGILAHGREQYLAACESLEMTV